MNRDDEELLRHGLITPPEDFLRCTMARIVAAPEPRLRRHPAMRDIAQWIALAGTVLIGATQVASYMFGIWIIGSAG